MRLIFACLGGWSVLAFATTLASVDPVTIRVDRPGALPAAGEPYLEIPYAGRIRRNAVTIPR